MDGSYSIFGAVTFREACWKLKVLKFLESNFIFGISMESFTLLWSILSDH